MSVLFHGENTKNFLGAVSGAVFARLNYAGPRVIMPLAYYSETEAYFGTTALVCGESNSQFILTVTANAARLLVAEALISHRETMAQVKMAAAPTLDMQIATKKYVDDKEFILQSTTPNSTKKFKITVDDAGTLSAVEVTT